MNIPPACIMQLAKCDGYILAIFDLIDLYGENGQVYLMSTVNALAEKGFGHTNDARHTCRRLDYNNGLKRVSKFEYILNLILERSQIAFETGKPFKHIEWSEIPDELKT